MRIYFEIAGIISLSYYMVIVYYTRKWNSTFAGFWAVGGLIHLAAVFLYPMVPEWAKELICVIVLAGWILFLQTELQIILAMKPKKNPEVAYLILLGAQVRGTKITNSLMRRIDSACRYMEKYPEPKVIVSGGQGKGEDIPEAEAMAGELVRRGIPEDRILKENRSASTWENLVFSGRIIGNQSVPVALVTNNFHLYRALILGKQAGYTNLHGIPASSNPVLLVNYMVREFFAVLLTKIKAML